MGNRRKLPGTRCGKPSASAEAQAALRVTRGQVVQMEHLPPEILAQFNEVIPGSARELLNNTLAESAHRRAHQDRALEANIALQQQILGRQDAETRNAFRSDVLGQCLGFIWNMCCLAAAAALAWFKPDMWKAAVAIAAMPAFTVGVKVVIDSRHLRKTKPDDSPH